MALAAKLDRGTAHIDADLLLPPATQAPQLRSREGGCRDSRLGGRTNGERGGERWFAAGQAHGTECGGRLAGVPPESGQCAVERGKGCHSGEIILYTYSLRKTVSDAASRAEIVSRRPARPNRHQGYPAGGRASRDIQQG